MNCILTRKNYGYAGVYGELSDEDGNFICYTLEHAFEVVKEYQAKVAVGTYQCIRGQHTLEHHPVPFSAFEIMGTPRFQGAPVTKCLFHIGNYNRDSDGCALLGLALGPMCILDSKDAFKKFMELQNDVESFILVVI